MANLIFGDFLMKKLVLGIVAIGLLSSIVNAKQVSTCTVLRGYDYGVYPINCGSGKTTLKAMYKKGWRFVGSAMSGSGGEVIFLEK
jgi:hypothetical protein